MSKMLPIPAPIIGLAGSSAISGNNSSYKHKRLFIPLIYLGGTASLCYLFLFALIISNEKAARNNHHHIHKRNPSGILRLWSTAALSSNSSGEKGNWGEGKRKERKSDNPVVASSQSHSASSSALLISELKQSPPPLHRKTLHSLRKTRGKRHNGTWRSNPTKIWSGHQDLDLLRNNHPHLVNNEKGVNRSGPALAEPYSYPWIEDEQCKSFTVQFAKKDTFKPRALVSFPGSGNSWLRYLIERASGIFTGSVYNDKKLFKSGLMGELRSPNDGSTILQKTHHDTVGKRRAYLKLSELMFSYRGVLLIRNPYDALVSYWNYLNNNSDDRHTGIASKNEFNEKNWANFVTRKISLWTSLITSWLDHSQDYLIVLYEDVQKNPRSELVRILEYLNQPVDTTRLDCLMKPEHLEGPFHRSHEDGATSEKKTSALTDQLLLDSFPSTITSTTLTASSSQQQDKNIIEEKGELPSSSPPSSSSSAHHQDGQTLFVLEDSKKSQRDQQQHPQTITAPVGLLTPPEEQKDKFLLLPTSSPSLSQTISSTPSEHHHHPQQNQEPKSRTIPISKDNHHHDRNNNNHNHLNNSSILRLDLIIQDNIDKINRFFQQKSIPLQLLYRLRPSIASYFLQPYNPTLSTPIPL